MSLLLIIVLILILFGGLGGGYYGYQNGVYGNQLRPDRVAGGGAADPDSVRSRPVLQSPTPSGACSNTPKTGGALWTP